VLSADAAVAGWPVRLTDSAGIRPTDCELEQAGVALATDQLAAADLVLWVVDALQFDGWDPAAAGRRADEELIEIVGSAARTIPRLTVVNKIDLWAASAGVLDKSAAGAHPVLAVSATASLGLDELVGAITARIAPESPRPGAAVAFTPRHVDALEHSRDELHRGNASAARSALAALLIAC